MRHAVVCLDAADTLFTERTSRAELYAEAFAAAGVQVPAARMRQWMAEVHEALPARLDGGGRYSVPWFTTFVGELLARAGSALPPEPLREHLEQVFTRPETYVVFADTFPTLDDLTEAGLRLALVSNWSTRLPRLLELLGLLPYFEVLAVSQAVGCEKPDRGIFDHALQRLGVEPSQALHVGNHPRNDVLGARRAGLSALLLDRRAPTPRPADVIGSLAELPAVVLGSR